MQSKVFDNLTMIEAEALATRFNLADAHPHQRTTARQREIIGMFPSIWEEASFRSQDEMDKQFLYVFFHSQNQKRALDFHRSLLFYSSSVAIMCAAIYFRQKKYTISLVEPCFDNLADIIRSQGVELMPVSETLLHDNIYKQLKAATIGDVLFLLEPVNPTGFSLFAVPERLDAVLKYCKDANKTLVLDMCFAPFARLDATYKSIDIYECLEAAGITYIVIEDTGKFCPTQDAKCAIITCSNNLYKALLKIQSEILLNVSPVILGLLCEFIRDANNNQFNDLRMLLDENRSYLMEKFKSLPINICNPEANVCVAWLKANNGLNPVDAMIERLKKNEIYFLPGSFFYWSNHAKGKSYFRIALLRNPDCAILSILKRPSMLQQEL